MSSIVGPAPVLDFDGTIASLLVDWARLRATLGVESVDDLWCTRPDGWSVVRDAELLAARRASPVRAIANVLDRVVGFAVLTSNSADAVEAFLSRWPAWAERTRAVIGREQLRGPKKSFERFREGFARCVEATRDARGGGPVVYVGDAAYELDFATRLGAVAIDVTQLDLSVARRSC
jgi:hypothetical protein